MPRRSSTWAFIHGYPSEEQQDLPLGGGASQALRLFGQMPWEARQNMRSTNAGLQIAKYMIGMT
jgi:hypothetical protein